MGWFQSILIGLITAVLGGAGACLVATSCVRWYRISSFEGASGYYVVFVILLGIVVGMIGGTVCARIVASREGVGFLQGLGVALGSMGTLTVVVGLICWLAADLAPTIDGRALELAIEIRGPKEFTLPIKVDDYGAFAGVHLSRGRHQPTGELRLGEARQVDGRWIVTATVPLQTSSSDKHLRAYFNKENDALFWLPLRRHPNKQDMEWSKWVESGWNANQPEPPPEGKFNLRYKVQLVEPPPPGPTQAEIAAEESAKEQETFDAMDPEAPITEWMRYTKYGTPDDRREIAIANITERPAFVSELATLMASPDAEVAAEALRLIEHIPHPTSDLNAPVVETGRSIAALIRKVNAITAEQDPSYLGAAEVSIRFSAWMVAVRTLREKSGGDFTSELREILELSRLRPDSHAMRGDVLRVASYYMQQWTGLEPLATDPKPR